METINKVHLVGKVHEVKDVEGAGVRMLLSLSRIYKDVQGRVLEHVDWITVRAIGGVLPQKGDVVEVEGRLQNERYVDDDGDDHVRTIVVASDVKTDMGLRQTVNEVSLRGRVGAVRTGGVELSFSLALNRIWRDRNGCIVEEITWVSVNRLCRKDEVFDIKKGDTVEVKGHISENGYLDEDGNRHSIVSVMAENFTII